MRHIILSLSLLASVPAWGESLFAPSQLLPEAKDALVSDLYLSSSGLVAVGERGHLFSLGFKGLTPNQEPLPVRQFLTCITETPKGSMVIGGHDAVILRKEKGEPWLLAYENRDGEAPIFSMTFNNNGVGLAVGAYGLVLRSTDDGKTWEPLELDLEEPHLYQVKTDGVNFYASGEWGHFIRIKEDGTLDQKFETGVETTLFGFELTSKEGVVLYGLRGLILKTQNLEEPFSQIENESVASLFNSYSYKGGVLICGSAGTLLHLEGTELTNYSLTERVDITDLIPLQDKILLGTTSGFREKPVNLME